MRSGDSTAVNGGVVFRNKNTHSSMGGAKQHVRYSWQVTDIDDAIEKEEVSINRKSVQ